MNKNVYSILTINSQMKIVKKHIKTKESNHKLYVVDYFIKIASRHTGISIEDIQGKCRSREIVDVRYVLMYLIRKYTLLSLSQIGASFGRDHSTVVYGIQTATTLIDSRFGSDRFKRLFKDIEDLYLESIPNRQLTINY